MYDCMRGTSYLASLYFIGLIIFGNIIMVNLFLAVLLGKFEEVNTQLQLKMNLKEKGLALAT